MWSIAACPWSITNSSSSSWHPIPSARGYFPRALSIPLRRRTSAAEKAYALDMWLQLAEGIEAREKHEPSDSLNIEHENRNR
jgi:hypothetical protein